MEKVLDQKQIQRWIEFGIVDNENVNITFEELFETLLWSDDARIKTCPFGTPEMRQGYHVESNDDVNQRRVVSIGLSLLDTLYDAVTKAYEYGYIESYNQWKHI